MIEDVEVLLQLKVQIHLVKPKGIDDDLSYMERETKKREEKQKTF